MRKILAVVGMCGSGKSVAVDFLTEKKEWGYIRFGQIVIDKLKEKGKAINPENEKNMRESLRSEFGMSAFALLNISKIENMFKTSNVVIDGLYSWSEYKILKEKFPDLKVIAIHASPEKRYQRLQERKHEKNDLNFRNRSLTANQARERDYAEIENIEKGGPIAMADYHIVNESGIDVLKNDIQNIIFGG